MVTVSRVLPSRAAFGLEAEGRECQTSVLLSSIAHTRVLHTRVTTPLLVGTFAPAPRVRFTDAPMRGRLPPTFSSLSPALS